MAETIKGKFNVDAEFIKSGGGVFEVRVDDELIFSKKALGRFPDDEEIVAKLASS